MVKLSAHQQLGNRRSSVFSETRMTSLCSNLVTNNRRVSFVHNEQRSVGEGVSKDASPRQGVVTFTFPCTLRRSSAQTARLDAFGEHPRVHLSRPRCPGPITLRAFKAKEGSAAQNRSMVTPRTREILHRASVTSAVPRRGWPLFYSRNTGGHRVTLCHIALCQARRRQRTSLC